MASRPYLTCSAKQLEALAEEYAGNDGVMADILRELMYRTTPTARELRERVTRQRRERLDAPHVPTDATSSSVRTPESPTLPHRTTWRPDDVGDYSDEVLDAGVGEADDDGFPVSVGADAEHEAEAEAPSEPLLDSVEQAFAARVQRLRNRLLDITNRNALIDCRNARKKWIDIVDEIPTWVVEALEGGKKLHFEALPEPEDHTSDGDLFGPQPTLPSETVEPTVLVPLITPSVEMAASTRARRGRPPRKDRFDRLAAAQRAGVNNSLDLPALMEALADAHRDNRLQTLLFPDELERDLDRLREKARTAEQELGTNPLHLFAGIIEWVESGPTATPPGDVPRRQAPLVVIPVQIERRGDAPVGHHTRYALSRGGDDVTTNVSFVEKCRQQFQVELPSIDATERLEAYFLRVEAVLAEYAPQWRLRRQLMLGTASFGRIRMWLDLGAKQLKVGVLRHRKTVSSLIVPDAGDSVWPTGADGEDGLTLFSRLTETHPIDDSHFVLDADGTQRRVLGALATGQTMVVEGPPGTGKSQTIVNAIAQTVAAGKSVLFVAQKETALSVVFDRLRSAGMEEITLPLFGKHATSRQRLAQTLRDRKREHGLLQRSTIGTDPALPEEGRLNAFAEALRTPWGPLQLAPYALFGRAEHAGLAVDRAQLHGLARSAQVDAASLDQSMLHKVFALGDDVARADATIRRRAETPRAHPWCGVSAAMVGSREQDAVIEAARAWRAAVTALLPLAEQLGGALESQVALSAETLSASCALLEATTAADGAGRRLRSALRVLHRGDPQQACDDAQRGSARLAHQWTVALPSWWRWQRLTIDAHRDGGAALDEAHRIVGDEASWGSLARHGADVAMASRSLTITRDALETAWRCAAGEHAAVSTRDLPALLRLMAMTHPRREELEAALRAVVGVGHVSLLEPARQDQVRTWITRLTELRAIDGNLTTEYDLDSLPPNRELRQHAESIRKAPGIAPALLSGAYRRARQVYRRAGGSPHASREDMATALEACADVLVILEAFAQRPAREEIPAPPTQRLRLLIEVAAVCDWTQQALDAADEATRPILRQALRELLASREEPTAVVWGSRRPAMDVMDGVDALTRLLTGTEANALLVGRLRRAGSIDEAVADLQRIKDTLEKARAAADGHVAEPQATVADIRAVWHRIGEAYAEEARSPLATEVATCLMDVAPGPSYPWDALAPALAELSSHLRAAVVPELWPLALASTEASDRLQALVSVCAGAPSQLAAEAAARHAFARAGDIDWALWFRREDDGASECLPETVALTKTATRLQEVESAEYDLGIWSRFWQGVAGLRDAGLISLVRPILDGELNGEGIAHMVRAVLYRVASEYLLREHVMVQAFEGADYEALRHAFAVKDTERMRGRGARIRKRVATRPIPAGPAAAVKSQLRDGRLIDHQGGLKRGHRPIREVTQRAANAIRTLTPCVLSTPEGVAQYLPAEALVFDLVIIDEASQMRPEVALGALMRGLQAAIVGDSQQLGPDSLFEIERTTDEDEDSPEDGTEEVVVRPDGETVIESAESILTAAATLWPRDSLGWHYRSQSDQLIAFSNRMYYDNRLVVFPSAGVEDGRGVFSHRIPGAYQGGANARVNVQEMDKVVALVAAHVREYPDQSLMVVTFNAPQRDLILDGLREAERDDEVLRQYREAWERQEAPLVVRNLVNVQGDERDRVIISTTFGPPPEGGPPKQNFGDIGRAEGARRINVLVTRAKLRIDVVTSLDPDDIRPSERSQQGVHRFQEYLRYARGERWWAEDGAILERDFDSPFEEAVYESLRRKGYAVEKQVGVSTYRVDLAVRHPEFPTQFLLGIECDGATYHSSREARDRDRLREAHLRRLGWTLHRVWSTDWFRWPSREMERLERAINTRLIDAGVMPAVAPPRS
jgi:very-short-patch-repair endonuclease